MLTDEWRTAIRLQEAYRAEVRDELSARRRIPAWVRESVGAGPVAFVEATLDVGLALGEPLHFGPEGRHRIVEAIHAPVLPCRAAHDESGEREPGPEDGYQQRQGVGR